MESIDKEQAANFAAHYTYWAVKDPYSVVLGTSEKNQDFLDVLEVAESMYKDKGAIVCFSDSAKNRINQCTFWVPFQEGARPNSKEKAKPQQDRATTMSMAGLGKTNDYLAGLLNKFQEQINGLQQTAITSQLSAGETVLTAKSEAAAVRAEAERKIAEKERECYERIRQAEQTALEAKFALSQQEMRAEFALKIATDALDREREELAKERLKVERLKEKLEEERADLKSNRSAVGQIAGEAASYGVGSLLGKYLGIKGKGGNVLAGIAELFGGGEDDEEEDEEEDGEPIGFRPSGGKTKPEPEDEEDGDEQEEQEEEEQTPPTHQPSRGGMKL